MVTKKVKRVNGKKAATKEPLSPVDMFGSDPSGGRIWMRARESLTEAAKRERMAQTGRRDQNDSWGVAMPFDRLSEDLRRRFLMTSTSIREHLACAGAWDLSTEYVETLSVEPQTADEVAAYISRKVETYVTKHETDIGQASASA